MSTSARFTGAAGKDNTDRRAFNDYQSPAYAATIAVTIKPHASNTLVQVGALTGALGLSIGVGSSTTPPFVGDTVSFLFTAAADRIVTFGTGTLPTATLTVLAGKTANAFFMFNGAAWVETSRTVTA